jgi:hypothetical protein
MNPWAQTLWIQSLIRKHGPEAGDPKDYLVGPIVVVSGDAEFMEAL